jgi:hypothetical protein
MLASTPNQILMSPTNNSTAKAQYSFPKASRFPMSKPSTHNFYNIPDSFSKRTTSFGYGQKYDFTSGVEKTPDPGAYRTEHDILNKAKAFSFGISRDECKKFIESHPKADPSIPGPGAYAFSPKFGREGRNITISGKKMESKQLDPSPGPGTYNQSIEKRKGEYFLSTCRSAQSLKISSSSPRFLKESGAQSPAPGAYETDKGFLKNSQVLSTVKSSGARLFPRSERKTLLFNSQSPGPGSYRLPSEFGYYDGLSK